MNDSLQMLADEAKSQFGKAVTATTIAHGELTLEIESAEIKKVCQQLKEHENFHFEQLIDLCGVDYLHYGLEVEHGDVSRGKHSGGRYTVVYHLLSIKHNRRLRLRSYLNEDMPLIDSVIDIWNSAQWYEREAFDLFGIIFEGHPDLRRILTDYGFIGHPFRKDFPLSGHVEMRYDPEKKRVIYQPVSIEPRILVPRKIREEGYGGRNS